MANTRRAPGTGSIKRNGDRFIALTPVPQQRLGVFDTEGEAEQAIADHLAAHPHKHTRRKRGSGAAPITTTKGINRYLDDVEAGIVNGKQRVALGAIGNGLPGFTNDPEVVERAIKVVREKARTGSATTRLKYQQRIITLNRQLEGLVAEGDTTNREFFVAHAAEWAQANGVGYSAFRVMGVPPDVLNEAGITRTFEP